MLLRALISAYCVRVLIVFTAFVFDTSYFYDYFIICKYYVLQRRPSSAQGSLLIGVALLSHSLLAAIYSTGRRSLPQTAATAIIAFPLFLIWMLFCGFPYVCMLLKYIQALFFKFCPSIFGRIEALHFSYKAPKGCLSCPMLFYSFFPNRVSRSG